MNNFPNFRCSDICFLMPVLFCSVFLFSSCNNPKDDTIASEDYIELHESVYNDFENLTEGTLFCKVQGMRKSRKSYFEASGYFLSPDKSQRLDIGRVQLNQHVLIANPDEHYQYFLEDRNSLDLAGHDIFGSIVTFKSEKSEIAINEKLVSGFSREMYIPTIIRLNDDVNFAQSANSNIKRFSRTEGLLVEWNIDAKNENGVLVNVFWDGKIFDEEHKRTVLDRNFNKSIVVPDKGQFFIDNNFLADIPANAFVRIKVKRGNLKKQKIDNYGDIRFYGYSSDLEYYIIE